jgi:hypothetical protein
MPSVRIATDRAVKVDVDVEAMVALIREAGTGRFIETMLDFCRRCIGADFVSVFAYSRAGNPTLVGTATTTAAENARRAAIGYMQNFANDVNFDLVSRRRIGAYVTYQTADEIASPQYRHACYERTGSPTGFRSCASSRRDPRPSVSIAAATMAVFPIANSTEPMHCCRY